MNTLGYNFGVKLAIARYEKEIAKGTIGRRDIVPSLKKVKQPDEEFARRATRDILQAPSPVAPRQLAKNRRLSNLLFEQQSAHPGPGIRVNPYSRLAATDIESPTPVVYENPSAGAMFRQGYEESKQRSRPAQLNLRGPPAVDKTLQHAILRHELGEVGGYRNKTLAPLSGHVSIRPLLEENMALRNDPDARNIFYGARMNSDPDSFLGERYLRQAGGIPGRPLPIGGKHESTLNKMIGRNPAILGPKARSNGLALTHFPGVQVLTIPRKIRDLEDLSREGTSFAHSEAKSIVQQFLEGQGDEVRQVLKRLK